MPPKARGKASATRASASAACTHEVLYTGAAPHATSLSFYKTPSQTELFSATLRTGTGKPPTELGRSGLPPLTSFPSINLLPQDALDLDPTEDPQSLWTFCTTSGRNAVTARRSTIYVVDVPAIDPKVVARTLDEWTKPAIPEGCSEGLPGPAFQASRPRIDDIAGYLRGFYTGLELKVLKNHFRFTTWRQGRGGALGGHDRGHVGLMAPDGSATRVRFRPSLDGVTAGQLNLNDMLDALLACAPSDAFAILLITDHDLYEDEKDDFCAGRAYGGSRICIVSTFRYNPALDGHAKMSHAHAWPASHCRDFVDGIWEASEPALRDTSYGLARRRRGGAKVDPHCMIQVKDGTGSSPLAAAVAATSDTLMPRTSEDWDGMWLARVCRTASHELGHCFGIGHCTYYACVMQGTASIEEDVRQPPYLCPVCLNKVAYACAGERVMKTGGADRDARSYAAETEWIVESYRQMRSFCETHKRVGMFGGLHAWLTVRLGEVTVPDVAEEDDGDDVLVGDDSSVIFLGSAERQ